MKLSTWIAIIILLALAVGCAKKHSTIAGNVQPFVNEFHVDATAYGLGTIDENGLIVQFGTLWTDTSTVIGLCQTSDGSPLVTLDQRWFDNADDESRRILVYHELGHCLLGQVHRPDSIMEPIILSDNLFEKNTDEYLSEFFKHQGQ
jgi:hypothetical protein